MELLSPQLAGWIVVGLLLVWLTLGVHIGVALGSMARGLLLTNANGQYFKLKQRGLADDAIRVELADKASPSIGSALAALAGAILVQAALLMLLPA